MKPHETTHSHMMQKDQEIPEDHTPQSINPWVDKDASPKQRKESLMDMVIG